MIGVFSAFLSAIFMTAKDTLSKKVASQVDGTVSTFASFAFAIPYYLLILPIFYLLGFDIFTTSEGFLMFIIFRSLTDTVAEWCKMHAFKYGDLSLVSSLLALYPAILLLISPLITGDHISINGIVGVLVTVLGTLVVLYRPKGSKDPWPTKAIVFGVCCAIFMSLNTCFDRMAVQTGSPMFSGFLMTLFAGIFLIPGMLRVSGWQLQLSSERKPFALRGFFEVLFMVIKLIALQNLAAPYVVGILRISLLFSIISGKVIFQEKRFFQRLLGGLLVIAGVLILVIDSVR